MSEQQQQQQQQNSASQVKAPAQQFVGSYPVYSGYTPFGQQFARQVVQVAPTTTTTTGAQGQGAGQLAQSQYVSSQLVSNASAAPVKGESRIEYIPYEKSVVEYEPVERIEYVAREKKVVDHYAVEYQTEYIPQVYQDKYIEYVPTERVVERVEYQAVQRQVVHPPQQEVVQQPTVAPVQYIQTTPSVQTQSVQYVQAPVQYVQAPSQYVQAPVQYVQAAPLTYSTYLPQYGGVVPVAGGQFQQVFQTTEGGQTNATSGQAQNQQ